MSAIPDEAIFDRRIPRAAFRTLAALYSIAWDGSASHPAGETAPIHPEEFASLLGISRSTFYEDALLIRRAGWLSYRSAGDGRLVFSLEIPPSDRPIFRTSNGKAAALSDISDSSSSPLRNEDSVREEDSGEEERPESRIADDELVAAGIGNPLRSELVADLNIDGRRPTVTLDWIRAHIGYARSREDGTRFLAQRLRRRDPRPDFCEACGGADGHRLDCEVSRRRYVAEIEELQKEDVDGE